MKPKLKDQQHLVDEWNRQYPIGTPVIRYKAMNPLREATKTKTTSVAYILSGHTAVIMVDGKSGCVALQSVTPAGIQKGKA